MIKIGITGSLASGKSTVAKMISSGKYPLYNADIAVKKIYQTNICSKHKDFVVAMDHLL